MPNFNLRGNYRDGLWNANANWGHQYDDRLTNLSTVLPEEQLNAFNEIIASGGIYDENAIMNGRGTEDALRRKQYEKYLSRRYARRLGSRAGGAAETMFANNFLAPQMASDFAERRSIRKGNAESIFRALQGRSNVMNTIIQQYLASQQEDDGGGLMDWLNIGTDLASFINWPKKAATTGANAARKIYD